MIRATAFWVGVLAATMLGCSSEPIGANADVNDGAPGGTQDMDGAATLTRAAYPEGPYGRGVGATIANLTFLGWRNPGAANYDPTHLERIQLADFYNPGGTTNDVKLILLNASGVWCAVCNAEYRHLKTASIYETFRPKGLEILGVLFEDIDHNPAKPDDLVVWGGPDGYQLSLPLVIDPAFKTGVYFESDATPMNMLIDATTMQIVDVTMGYDTSSEDYWTAIDAWLAP